MEVYLEDIIKPLPSVRPRIRSFTEGDIISALEVKRASDIPKGDNEPNLKEVKLDNYRSRCRSKRNPTKRPVQYRERRVSCYCVCKKFSRSSLRQYLRGTYELERYRDVYYFNTKDEELKIVDEIKTYVTMEEPLTNPETDHFNYQYWGNPSIVNNDEILLCIADMGNDSKVKVAISHGIAQSIKLSVFEDEINNLIEETKRYPEQLAHHGKILLTRVDIFKKMGKLWMQKNEVYLHSDILDVPEFFHENSSLYPLFRGIIDYLDVQQRVKVLNNRLYVVGDLFHILNEGVHSHHKVHLEWILIWVIIAGLCLEVINLTVDGYGDFS